MVKYREILRLTAMGVSQNSIALSYGCAQSIVSELFRQRRIEAYCPGPLDHPFGGVPVTYRRSCDLADGITQGMEPGYLPVSRHDHDRYLLPWNGKGRHGRLCHAIPDSKKEQDAAHRLRGRTMGMYDGAA